MFVTDKQVEAATKAYWSHYYSTADEHGAMRAALTAAPASMWRPIEEAPKDGAPVDLWSPEHGGRLTNYRFVWLTKDNQFFEPIEGGYTCVRDATHFMPLPAPPAAVGGE